MWETIVNFVKNNWLDIISFVIGIIGAAAWIPTLVSSHKIKKRKIIGTVVDHRVISDAKVKNAAGVEKAKGTILMLAVNWFIAHESFFIHNCKTEVTLNDDKVYTGDIVDGSFVEHTDGVDAIFLCPKEYNFNLHREIIAEKDNIRIVSLMIKNSDFHSVNEIKQVKFIFQGDTNKSIYTKEIVFKQENFPELNHMKFIDEYFLKPGSVSTFRR